jgi:putative copper resistance protein D
VSDAVDTQPKEVVARTRSGPVLVGSVVAAVVVTVVGLATMGAVTAIPLGLPDPGPVTTWGLPLANLASELLAIAVVGCLLVPALTMKRSDEPFTSPGARALRAARVPTLAWLFSTCVELWLTASDQFAIAPGDISFALVRGFVRDSPQGLALAVQGGVVLALAVCLWWTTTPRGSLLLLGVALFALVPGLLTGHSASSGAHDTAVIGLLLHVLPAVVWVGGVVALWWHLGAETSLRTRAVRRFSALAAWCLAATAVSGVLSAFVRLDHLSDFVTSAYGRAALLKLLLVVVIGLVAARLRAVVRAQGTPDWRAFARFSAIELVAMAAAVGLGVALSRTPPPVGEPYQSLTESLLGGPMPPAPTLAGYAFSFRPSGIGLAVVLVGGIVYAVGVWTLLRRGDRWPVGRTVSWYLGLAAVGYATMGGVGVWSHVLFSTHMLSHMILSMLAPVLLVLGAPIPLALRALPGADVPGGEGPRQLLADGLNSWYGRLVTNFGFAAVMFVGSLYAIYFTDLYGWLMSNHLGHAFMELHFLLAGYLFYEVLIGSAPIHRRLPYLGRIGLLVAVAPFHAFFAVGVMSTSVLIGEEYYTRMDRPYATDLLADQSVGGGLTWALGEVPLLLVTLVLLFQWFRDDTRKTVAAERRAARDDRELRDYNEFLARINRGEATRADRDPATRRHLSDDGPDDGPAAGPDAGSDDPAKIKGTPTNS